jgi:NAD(P)-dependent dehydrogenase (short-subunit alcohol dehydrogenase family)
MGSERQVVPGFGVRTALVTGASSGLGLEAALRLAADGFRVWATMRDLERSGDLRAEADGRGLEIEIRSLDVTDPASIAACVEDVMTDSGAVDVLVANAGVQVRGFFEDTSDEEIRRVFDTNLFGAMAVARAVLPSMRKAGRGRVVFVGSVGGRVGSMASSAYCASKFALEGFAEALSLQVADLGLSVSVVEPGIVRTEIWDGNRGVVVGASDPASPYREWFSRLERLTDSLVASSRTTPGDVAEAIRHAATDPRPRLRYVVGSPARIVTALRRRLPESWFDALYTREIVRRVTGSRRTGASR